MNERIKELVEQSRVKDRGYFIYQYGGPNGHQSVEKVINLEKFAELIVRECINVIDEMPIYGSAVSQLVPSQIQVDTLLDTARTIKEHFGVEL